MSITQLTATELQTQLAGKQLSAEEVAREYLNRIERLDPQLHSFLWWDADRTLAEARAIDQARSAGKPLGLLAGLPCAVKDVLCTDGLVTTCASRMLANFRPPYDATVVQKLRQAGAVLLGKTNMDEFAMGGTTENSAFGLTRNPWDPTRVPGGSSGGAAACVAADLAPLSIGSDTGGSIRQPAAFCGVVGMKPTYGRVSRSGLVAFASSLDQVGPLARTVEDVALLLEAIAGHDPRDSTSAQLPVPRYTQTVGEPLEGLRLGLPREFFGAGLDPEVGAAVEQAINVYQSLGARIQEISLPHSRYAIAAYYIIAPSEASSNLARYDGVHYGYRTDEQQMTRQLERQRKDLTTEQDEAALDELDSPLVRLYRQTRAEGFGAEVKRRIMLGTYALSAGYYDAYYLKALRVRRLIRQDYDQVFQEVDLVVGPVTPSPAFPLGAMVDDPLALYLQDLYTVSANLAGLAGLSVPCGFSSGQLPIGFQLQSPPFQEERLLRAASMYQRATDWHTRRPALS
jgi:aspartyl-tRNA(Asn)/glutamyl-tRNA(Gln) amidotransferase subunit A